MRVPINWLKDFVELPKTQKELTDGLTLVGHMLDKINVVDGEVVLDLELRGNRADCYSIYGIAREVHATFAKKIKDIPQIKLKSSPPKHIKATSSLVARAATIEIHGVTISKSPRWLSSRLKQCGIDSINNIVDLTNYVMLETGEPMHAFDLDKVGTDLEIRLAKNGEKITTFAGSEIVLTDDDLVWTKGDQILSVAGAIGEKYHSVSATTRNILLECANYNRANIRKTVYRHNLLTEAGVRHEKNLDPNLVETTMGRFLYLLKKEGWGDFEPVIHDYYPKKISPWKIVVDPEYDFKLGGTYIDMPTVKRIFDLLNFKISEIAKNRMEITVPTHRTDVRLEEDLVEEILRIYGYDKIPAHILALEIPKNITPKFIKQEKFLKDAATSVGFDEAITSSFVSEKYLNYNLYPDGLKNKIVSLLNPPSPDFSDMRLTLLPNLLENTRKAIGERAEEVALFEIGKVYSKVGKVYIEERKIAFIYWSEEKSGLAAFKGLINAFFAKANIETPVYNAEINNLPLNNSYNLIIKNRPIGFGGEMEGIQYAEINLDEIINDEKAHKVALWPKYPPQIEDLTLTLPAKTHIGDVINKAYDLSETISRIELKDIYKDAYTFRIWYQNPKKTLTDKEVEEIRNRILTLIKSKFGGQIKN